MRRLKIFIVSLVLLVPLAGYSQNSLLKLGFWNISALSGELKAGTLYGQGNINTYGIDNRITTSNYYGGIMLKSSSYIWTPNFMIIDVDGGYYPESRQDMYLVSSNIYNVIDTRKLHIGTTFFQKKPITLSTHLNFDDSYDRRENLTDIKTKSKSYGATFSYRNKFLPLTVAYNESQWDSKEIQTGRDFFYRQKNLEGRVTKSFGKNDRNDLLYTHNDYYREDYSLYKIRNVSDNLELQDGFFLDSAKRSHFNSNIFGTIQKGNDSFKQLRINENLFYKLAHNFTLNTSYGYSYIDREPEKLGQHSVNTMLGHQLFESLHSGLLYEYNNAHASSYDEVNHKVGLDLSYTKKTFGNGLLNIQYAYNKIFERRVSTDVLLNVLNEEYTITDRVMLKRPYIDAASIVIKDVTGTTIYQAGLDYILTPIGNFIEIQRIPGGMIPDNSKIFLFYTATQPGTYDYEINQNNFSIDYSFFKRFFDVYYKTYRTDYMNINHADNLLLNYISEDIYGTSIRVKSATIGAEYDDYRSSLVPYRMMRYFFTLQGNMNQRFLYSVNANWRDYKIPTELAHRIYKDVNAMVSYAFSRRSRIDVSVGYQSQEGKQINLDLFTARSKFTTMLKQLTLVAGVDAYDRVYLDNQKTNYIGAYIQIVKKFKY
jgi:hypothetical protein